MEQSHRHLQHLLYRFLRGSRTETPQGSQLAFAPGDVATRIRPTTERHSLFPTPIPAPPSVDLTTFLPSFRKERYGLTTFHKIDKDGLGALCPPVALRVHDRILVRSYTHYGAILAQACQHLRLVAFNDVYRWVGYERGPLLAFSPSPPPNRTGYLSHHPALRFPCLFNFGLFCLSLG